MVQRDEDIRLRAFTARAEGIEPADRSDHQAVECTQAGDDDEHKEHGARYASKDLGEGKARALLAALHQYA